MNFLRYQEFYESPNPKFRNKSFTILEFMDWYSRKYGNGIFAYPQHWSGFNFDSETMIKCIDLINDYNFYDNNMLKGYEKCLKKSKNNKFYIIGTMEGNTKTLLHECAHGYFYLNKTYKKEMTKLVKMLPNKVRKNMEEMLTKLGYTKQVFIDEIQAYFSTSSKEELELRGVKLKNEDKVFKELFNEYNK